MAVNLELVKKPCQDLYFPQNNQWVSEIVPVSVIERPVAVTGSISDSQLSWDVKMPTNMTGISSNVLIDILVDFQLSTTFSAPVDVATSYPAMTDYMFPPALTKQLVAGSAVSFPYNPAHSGDFSLRGFPISQISTNTNLTLNNDSLSLQSSEIVSIYYDYTEYDDRFLFSSLVPAAMDVFSTYEESKNTVCDPLSGMSKSLPPDFLSRGSYPFESATRTLSADRLTLTENYSFRLREYLSISPFEYNFSTGTSQSLYGVEQWQLNITLNQILRAFSTRFPLTVGTVAPPVGFGKVAIQSYSANLNTASPNSALLHVKFIQPPLTLERPLSFTYRCDQIQNHIKTIGTISNNNNVARDIYSDSITLSTIPDKIYIFLSRQKGTVDGYRTDRYPDTYPLITGISIDFANTTGILSSATLEDLYKISVLNGYKKSFPVIFQSGNILCLSFRDIGLAENLYPGVRGKFYFSYRVTVQNLYQRNTLGGLTADSGLWQLNTITLTSGVITLSSGNSNNSRGFVSEENAASLKLISDIIPREVTGAGGTGGVDIRKGLSLAPKALSSVLSLAELVPDIIDVVKGNGSGGAMLGSGGAMLGSGGAMLGSGGAMLGSGAQLSSSSFPMGGKQMKKSELAKYLSM